MMQAEQESGESSPVVTDDIGAGEVERVQHCHRIIGKAGRAIATAGCFAPAKAAQVRYQQPVVAAELLDDPAPAPPVLRPAVQEQHWRARARRGQMQADGAGGASDVDPVVLDARDGR
jgi:hypothetical protein